VPSTAGAFSVVDTNHHAGATVGWLEFAGLAVSTGWLAAALWSSATDSATRR
jgi:hypothetical protein